MSELPGPLAAALRDRYVLERELGRGGMATVYLAQDLKHERPVALKAMRPELAITLGPARFEREIKLAARLQHPHILSVFDSGIAAGRLWYTMPYVRGESLRDRLHREPQLPLDEALRITREAAQALQYAHDEGVIHRDIKPENILLTGDGSTLVADFGIARSTDVSATDQALPLTDTGVAIGTPAYMAPEQATGHSTIGKGADQYALAVTLYELLAGVPPFVEPTAAAIIARRYTQRTPSVRLHRPDVPPSVDGAIQRALSLDPAERFPSIADFVRALADGSGTRAAADGGPTLVVSAEAERHGKERGSRRRSIRATVAVLALAIAAFVAVRLLPVGRRAPDAGAPHPHGAVLAVLPFENLGDSANAYFADGVADEVRSKLIGLGGLTVIARASSNEYRRTAKRADEIARELGADYLLTGTVQWHRAADGANRVRVRPELVAVRSGRAPSTAWEQQFDAALGDVFAVQTDIARRVATALDIALADSARRALSVNPTASLEAYDAFLKGESISQSVVSQDPASMRRAITFYERAVTLDSAFVPAWAQLSRARSRLYYSSTPSPTLDTAARLAAERALSLGPGRVEGQLALGEYYRSVRLDFTHAIKALEAGLARAPNDVELLSTAAASEVSLGRWDAALQHLLRAAALDPRSVRVARNTGYVLLAMRRYPAADSAMQRGAALAPGDFDIIEDRTMLALAQGDLAGARRVIAVAARTVDPTTLVAYIANYQDLYWVLDDADQRRLLTFPASVFDNDRGIWAHVRAQTYALRGNWALARLWADTSRDAFEAQLRASPEDAQRHAVHGLALAYLGRAHEAIAEGQRAVVLLPITRDANLGAYIQHQLVRIYIVTGEPERALDQLEPLLSTPSYLSPGWLRIDPGFASLRGNPRFERLIGAR